MNYYSLAMQIAYGKANIQTLKQTFNSVRVYGLVITK